MIITDRQEELGRWLCPRTGGRYVPGAGVYIGNEINGKLVAVVGYEDYNGASVRIHVAGEGHWMTREFLWFAFYYPFEQMKVKKLIGLVAGTNERALKLDKHLGYVEEAVIKDAVPGGDLHILTMTKEQCRFLKRKLQ